MNESLYRSKSDEDRKEKFFVWLAAKVSPAQLSELYDNQHRIDQFCLPRKLLEKPLFQNGDADTIQKLVKELKKSLPFKLQKNVGLLFFILNYYSKRHKYLPFTKRLKRGIIDSEVFV